MLDIINKINNLSVEIIVEGIGIIIVVNFIFAIINYKIYLQNPSSYYYDHPIPEELDFFEFIYYSFTTSFLLGCDVKPNNVLTKTLSIVQLVIIFFLFSIIISEVI
jgi:hypothetical protein